jgi:hypothetical protein
LLNDLFADPPALMAALVDGGMVTPGDPGHSVFFELTAPTGPMFRIFSDPELETWREWIRSLGSSAPKTGKPLPRTIAEQMAHLVDTMRPRQHSAAAHKGAKLVGDDPESPGHLRKEPVSWWFEQPASVLMAALAHPENNWIVLGDAASSRFITDIARGKNAMARALNAETPDGTTGVSVIEQWINARCPLPDAASTVRPITLLSPPERVAAHPSGQIHGAGSVH